MPSLEELQKGFVLGEWEVLPLVGVLRSGDAEEKPEPMVLKVLLSLASRDGDLVTRNELIDEIWDGRPIGDEPINRCIALLRGHLGDKDRPHQYIETLTKRGYRLSRKIHLNESATPATEQRKPAGEVLKQARLWMVVATVVATILIAMFMRIGLQPEEVHSIAVLPFENLSGDPADQYLAAGLKEELVYTLHGIPGMAVKPVRGEYPGREISEIAQILGVDAVLFGAVQRDGVMLRINYNVARGYDGVNISSGSVSGEIGGEFALQGRVAVLVRNDLLGESPQQLISANRNPNSRAFESYMRGIYALERRGRGKPENLADAIQLFEQAIRQDPDFGAAYLSLAMAYALLPDYANAPLVETHERAIEIVERGIEADPSLADSAGAVYGFVYQKQRLWTKAEQAYIRATTARVVDSNAFNWYSLMLSGVGRLDDALNQVLEAQKINPSSPGINSRVGMVHTWLGNSEKAAEFFERADQLGASGATHMLGEAMLLIRKGRLGEAESLVAVAVSMTGRSTDWVSPVLAAIGDPSMREVALTAIEEAFSDPDLDPRFNILARSLIGDTDGAMKVAVSLAGSAGFLEMDFLFLEELQPLRQNPGFLLVMDKLGVQDYWAENGCSWQGDKVSC